MSAAAAAADRSHQPQKSYVMSRIISEGNFGVIRKCRHKFSRDMYAAKIVKLPVSNCEDGHVIDASVNRNLINMMKNEVDILKKLQQHPNVVRFIDAFYTQTNFTVITELSELGDLEKFLSKEPILPEDTARLFSHQIASAIKYMHSLQIVHRDIKPENILLFKSTATMETEYTLKLCDFGISEEVITMCGLKGVSGSPGFVAPEILRAKSYGLRVDIWSMGVVFYMMLCGYFPFEQKVVNEEQLTAIMTSNLKFPQKEWDHISLEAKALIASMLKKYPSQRLRASHVLSHRWFRKLNSGMGTTNRFAEISRKTAADAANALKTFTKIHKLSRNKAIVPINLVGNAPSQEANKPSEGDRHSTRLPPINTKHFR